MTVIRDVNGDQGRECQTGCVGCPHEMHCCSCTTNAFCVASSHPESLCDTRPYVLMGSAYRLLLFDLNTACAVEAKLFVSTAGFYRPKQLHERTCAARDTSIDHCITHAAACLNHRGAQCD